MGLCSQCSSDNQVYLKIAFNQKATQLFDWSYSHAEARPRPRRPLHSPPETLSVQGQDKMVAFRQWQNLFYAVPLRWLDTQVLRDNSASEKFVREIHKINQVNWLKELNSSLACLLSMKCTAGSPFKPWCRQNVGVAEVPEIAHIWPIHLCHFRESRAFSLRITSAVQNGKLYIK